MADSNNNMLAASSSKKIGRVGSIISMFEHITSETKQQQATLSKRGSNGALSARYNSNISIHNDQATPRATPQISPKNNNQQQATPPQQQAQQQPPPSPSKATSLIGQVSGGIRRRFNTLVSGMTSAIPKVAINGNVNGANNTHDQLLSSQTIQSRSNSIDYSNGVGDASSVTSLHTSRNSKNKQIAMVLSFPPQAIVSAFSYNSQLNSLQNSAVSSGDSAHSIDSSYNNHVLSHDSASSHDQDTHRDNQQPFVNIQPLDLVGAYRQKSTLFQERNKDCFFTVPFASPHQQHPLQHHNFDPFTANPSANNIDNYQSWLHLMQQQVQQVFV